MSDYPISEEALEAGALIRLGQVHRQVDSDALLTIWDARTEIERQAFRDSVAPIINAFLAAERFEVEENVLPTSYEKRLVGKWRAFEG